MNEHPDVRDHDWPSHGDHDRWTDNSLEAEALAR